MITIVVSKKEFEKLKERHDHLERMVLQLGKRLHQLEQKDKPEYFA
ncbi:hypothetical protein [Gracilibacillus thailandensis]|nr:hypothetical protein [Gracilibacillus thailandensis]